MKDLKKHIIAVLGGVLFAITFLPFNAFHHHDEDEHRMAHAGHSEKHFCELDSQFCQDETAKDCGHGKHLGKPIGKCFSCQFQFEKNYEQITTPSLCIASFTREDSYCFLILPASGIATPISNKGPPHTA